MKIGIFSDLHNRTDHLEPAMHRMRLLGCGHFIFLGDCTTPESFRRLIELTEDFPLDAVPGNNDYDVETMRRMDASSGLAASASSSLETMEVKIRSSRYLFGVIWAKKILRSFSMPSPSA